MKVPVAMLCIPVLALAACAGQTASESPSPYLVAPVREVSNADQGRYWLLDDSTLMRSHADAAPADGCFRAQVLIDSNGRVFEPKILAMVGTPAFHDWIPGFLSHLGYRPAPENLHNTPIRTTLSWTFSQTIITPKSPSTASARAAASAVLAAEAKGSSPAIQEWYEKCTAEMDKQMGVSPPTTGSP